MAESKVRNQTPEKASKETQRGHVLPRSPLISIHSPGRLRCAHVLALFGISHSTLYARMNKGTFPLPDGNDGRNYWNTETIVRFLEFVVE